MPKSDEYYMSLAIAAASKGQGAVEPNPMVGCAIVADHSVIAVGWHEKFGGPHAEVNALNSVSEEDAHRIAGSTVYVTLEPCSHHGKTGPCCDALIDAGVGKVVIAVIDPNPEVAGQGIRRLQAAEIQVEVGQSQQEAAATLGPYLKRETTGYPWIVAKWAMTIDGRIASASGSSQWISNQQSRSKVHQLRRRCDAVLVGIGTALADDPLLTPRPAGDRDVLRVVVDSTARLPLDSQLVKTAGQHRTLIAVGPNAAASKLNQLRDANCETWQSLLDDPDQRLGQLMKHLSKVGCTNVMVEGGGKILGALNDLGHIDEAHVFIGGKLLGGQAAISPVAGLGQPTMPAAVGMNLQSVQRIDDDIYAIYRRQPTTILPDDR